MSMGGERTRKAEPLYGITKSDNTYVLNLNNIQANKSNVVFPFSTITKNNCANFKMTAIGKTVGKSSFENTFPNLVIGEDDVDNYNVTLEERPSGAKITSTKWETKEWPQ
jgi:hypothetical protein